MIKRITHYEMEEREPMLQRFFFIHAVTALYLAIKTKVISGNPTLEEIKSYLNTIAWVIPSSALIAITYILVEIFYIKFIKPKIFKDDNNT